MVKCRKIVAVFFLFAAAVAEDRPAINLHIVEPNDAVVGKELAEKRRLLRGLRAAEERYHATWFNCAIGN